MKAPIKHIVTHTYKPWLERYLSRPRMYRYHDIKLLISPDVFHPGFFFTTKVLLNYISKLPLYGKTMLELGCGSGLIAMAASKKGALVTATDINGTAIGFLEKNAIDNQVEMRILQSDLFQNIPRQTFDIIAINPPFYKKQPQTEKDYAWFCGENGEYFEQLFLSLSDYMHPDSIVLMILIDGCDREMVQSIASKNGFGLQCMQTRKNLLERNFIYQIIH